MSLRTKLILAFGGPLAILMVLGIISVRTISESSNTLERIFRENYDSVAACLKMKDAIEVMDRGAELFLWDGVKNETVAAAEHEFASRLKFQQGNVTLPGEQELTNSLTGEWNAYRSLLEEFFSVPDGGSERREFYRTRLLPQSERVLNSAQRIVEINLNNMVSTDGQVRRKAAETNRTMILLVLTGIVLAVLFVGIIGPSIIRPISRLTRSVQEIQQGNLDLFVKVSSKDEIGKLAEAFNEMTSSLREFRRTNRARLLRTEKATLSGLNSLSDAIAICSPDGEIELSNETAVKMFALAPGSSVIEAQHESVRELFGRAIREMRPIRDKGWDSAIQNFSDGEEKFFLPEAIPIFDDERRLVGITIVLSDVTGLRQLDEVKSGLISTVSHELKTPLTSIRLATHALLSEKLGPLSPQQTEMVAAAREDGDRLYRMIENLLDLSRMESGRSRLELLPANPEQVLMQVSDEMRSCFY